MDERDLSADPLVQFEVWLREAREAVPQAEAMTLATVGAGGRPSARQVLLRAVDERGFVFFTNRTSRKAQELTADPRAALVFHWFELGRQVRIEGAAQVVDDEESEAYWATRPRASRIAAWASPQSEPLAGREELDRLYAEAEARFEGGDVPLPPFWGGYRVVPASVEFWHHQENRLHDRIRFVREGESWRRERLAP
jgi:pyridoxamine 5'-phosphate oxidase